MSLTTNLTEFDIREGRINIELNTTTFQFSPNGLTLYILGATIARQLTLVKPFNLTDFTLVASKTLSASNGFFHIDSTLSKWLLIDNTNNKVLMYDLNSGDINTLTENVGNFFDFSSIDTGTWQGVTITDDGLELYLTSDGLDRIYQFTLSVAWDLTSATETNFQSSGLALRPGKICFYNGGTTALLSNRSLSGSEYDIIQLDFSVAYDLSTMVTRVSHKLDDAGGSYSSSFNNDGTLLILAGGTYFVYFELNTPWDINAYTYIEPAKAALLSAHISQTGFFMRPDGLGFYTSSTSENIYYFTLSTAWDITTASSSGLSFSVSNETNQIRSIALSSDGMKLYMFETVLDTIWEYDLVTAWDISSAAYNSVNYNIGTNCTGMFFKPDGTDVYIINTTTDVIEQHTLSIAWDISSASLTTTKSIVNEDNNMEDLYISENGKRLFAVGGASDTIYQYTLSAPWNIGSANYDGISLDISSWGVTAAGISFSPNLERLIHLEDSNNSIFQADVSVTLDNTAFFNEVNKIGFTAFWRVDEIEGTTAKDQAITYDGTYNNFPDLNVSGLILDVNNLPIGRGVAVDGVDQFISAPAMPSDSSGSVYMVVRFTGIDVSTEPLHLFSESESDTDYFCPISLSLTDGKLSFYSKIGGVVTLISGTTVLSIASTYHIVALSTGTEYELWLNGVKETLTVVAGTNDGKWFDDITAVNTIVGALDSDDDGTTTNNIEATVDEIIYFNKQLTPSEITKLVEIATTGGVSKTISGSITENLPVETWFAQLYNLETGELIEQQEIVSNFLFTLNANISDNVHSVTVTPDQGSVWLKDAAVFANALVFPTDTNSSPYYYKAKTTGQTGVSEPSWPLAVGNTVVDEGVTWECISRLIQPITQSPLLAV